MEFNDLLGQFFTEAARRSVDHLVHQAGHGRVCAHCRNGNLSEFCLTLPCCGRALCGPCTARVLVYRWDRRGVAVCDDCQSVCTFELPA